MQNIEASRLAEALFDSMADYAISLLDTEGRILQWNAGSEMVFGYSADEIIGQHVSRLAPDKDRATVDSCYVMETAEQLGRYETNTWRLRRDGCRMWVNLICYPVQDVDGTVIGFSQVMRDLTGGRQVADALQQGAETFRLLVEGVTDYAIYMLDPTGHITSWNAGAERFKGYTASEIIGQHFSRFYTPEDVERNIPAIALRTALKEGHFEAEGWRVRKNGDRFWASAVIDPIRNTSGALVGFAKITRDMTEQREAQIQLETTREAFFQAQKMEAIGKLTGGVAHDFNNLLAAILGSLELAQRRLAAGRDISQFLENAKQAAERGAELTQRMLAFARKQELKLEAVDVIAAVKGLAGLLARTIGPGISIDTQFPLLLPPARADASQLELAVLNLLVNARDAMPDGGNIRISARTSGPGELGFAEGRHVCLSIADEGTGMDEATLARAAEPFFTTKGVGKGTGLGLSMVQGMVEQCGGRFVLISRECEGTTAEVWLPVAEPDLCAPSVAAATSDKVMPEAKSIRVLAVDDDIIVLMNTATMLEDMGHRVLEASSAHIALEILRKEEVDLLVTDFAMPGMNGGELIAAAQEICPDLPVILLSGYVDLPDGHEIAVERIAKPFTESELARGIARVVNTAA